MPLQQQAELHFTGFQGAAPDGLVLNRLAESDGFFRLADPGPADMELGRDLLIATAPQAFQPGEPVTLTAEARVWTPGEPFTLNKGDPLPRAWRYWTGRPGVWICAWRTANRYAPFPGRRRPALADEHRHKTDQAGRPEPGHLH
ncbi:hypothetical protein HML84_02475 [Alcanivorax sp. IO_7]|nr:hypothetical protein HML84_02475 [Alcanivorax sp. IO_7]